MNRLLHILFFTLLVCLSLSKAQGQNYPIQVTPIVRGGTDMRWSTFYSDPDKLKVRVVHKDKDVGTVGIFFKIKIERAGISIRSREDLMPPQVQAINMNFGQILDFTSTELYDYFRPENLVVQGLPPEFLYQGGTLPDGFYMVSITSYEYDAARGHRQVSNTGISSFAVFKGLPPIIQFPRDGQVFTEMAVQNVLFQWLPRTFSAPGAGGLSYKVELFMIDEGTHAREAANSTQPIFTAMTSATSLPYGPGYPGFVPLQAGKQYALRVQVVSTDEGQQFTNNGYSQIVTFSYGQSCVPPVNVSMAASDNFWDKLSWTPVPGAESYRVRFTSRVTGKTDSTEVYGSFYDLYNPNRGDTLTYSIVSLCSAGRRSSEVSAERPNERNLRAAAKVIGEGVPPAPQTSLDDILNPFDIPVNSAGKTDVDVEAKFAEIKNPYDKYPEPCGVEKLTDTSCEPAIIEPIPGSEKFNIVAGKYMYLNGYEILITAPNEGLLYLPLIKSRVPVEWDNLTVYKNDEEDYGCVTEGEARMQGSVTGAIARDLHRQVLALLTQGAGSFSGKFGEAVKLISAQGDSLKNNQSINWATAKGVLDAGADGFGKWKDLATNKFSENGQTIPPDIQNILNRMQTLKDELTRLSACVVQNIPSIGGSKKNVSAKINMLFFACTLTEQDIILMDGLEGEYESLMADFEINTGELQFDKMVLPLEFTVEGSNTDLINDNQVLIADADRRDLASDDSKTNLNKEPSTTDGRDYFKEIVSVWELDGTIGYRKYFENLFATPFEVALKMRDLANKPLVVSQLVTSGILNRLTEVYLKEFFMNKIKGYSTDIEGLRSVYSGNNKSKYEQAAASLLNHFYGKSGTNYYNTKVISDAIYDTDVGKRRIDNIIKIIDRLFYLKIGENSKSTDSNPELYKRNFTKFVLDNNWFRKDMPLNCFPSFGASDAISFNPIPGSGDNEKLGLFCIGGTQGLKVTVKSIEPIIQSGTRGYDATIIIQYLDTFGVSESDFTKSIMGGSMNYVNFNYRGGVLSQWILQHQYNYPPFTDFLTYEIKMKRTWAVK